MNWSGPYNDRWGMSGMAGGGVFSGRIKLTLRGKSVFSQALIYLVTAVSLIVLAGCGIYYLSIKSYLVDKLTADNEQLMRQTAAAYETFLDSTIRAVMVHIEQENFSVASIADSWPEYHDAIYKHLNNIGQISDFIYSIYYYNRKSQYIYLSSGVSYERAEFYDREWLDSLAIEKDFLILSARKLPALSAGEKDVIPVVINYPWNAVDHLFTYIINLDANQLFNYLRENTETDEIRSFKIIDRSGMINIASGDFTSIFRNIREYPHLNRRLLLQKTDGSYTATREGEKILVSYFTSPKYDWKYICEVNYETLTRNMRRPLQVIFMVTLFLLGVSVLVSFSISRTLYRPLRELAGLAGTGGRGDLTGNEYDIIRRHLRRYLDENQHLRKVIAINQPVLERQFLYNLVARDIYTPEEITEKLEYFGKPSIHDHYTVISLEIDDYDRYVGSFHLRDRLLWEAALEGIAMERVRRAGDGFFVGIETNRFALVFSAAGGKSLEEAEKTAARLAYQIKEAVRQALRFSVTAGVGKTVTSIGSIPRSYHEAAMALRYKEAVGPDEVILFREISDEEDIGSLDYPYELERELMQYLLLGNAEQARLVLQGLFEAFRKQRTGHRLRLRVFAVQLLNSLLKQLMEMNISENEVFTDGYDLQSLSISVMKANNINDLSAIFMRIIDNFCNYINKKRENISNLQVKQIVDYINENFQQSLSLELIAERIGLNRCYLGRLFKQYFGLNIVDYINQVRINKALELLNGTDLKVFEIAGRVGFNNTHYFIRIFKKVMNMTPGQYKAWLGKAE